MSISYEVVSWLDSVTQENDKKIRKPSPNRKKLIYILKVDDSNVFRVVPSVVSIKSDGSYGKNVKSYEASKINSGREWPKYLDLDDISILAIINKTNGTYNFSNDGYDLQQITNIGLLEKIIKTQKAHWKSSDGIQVVLGATKSSKLQWVVLPDGRQTISCKFSSEDEQLLLANSPWYINERTGVCGRLDLGMQDTLTSKILQAPPVKPMEVAAIQKQLSLINQDKIPALKNFKQVTSDAIDPEPCLLLREARIHKNRSYYYYEDYSFDIAVAELSFNYNGQMIAFSDPETFITVFDGKKIIKHPRNKEKEGLLVEQLKKHNLVSLGHYSNKYLIPIPMQQNHYTMKVAIKDIAKQKFDQKWENFMVTSVPILRNEGWNIIMARGFPYNIVQPDDDWYSNLSEGSGVDWFSFELGVNVNGTPVNLLPILLQALNDKDHIINQNIKEISPDTIWYFDMPDFSKLAMPAQRIWKIISFLKDIYNYKTLDNNGNLVFSKSEAANMAELDQLTEHLNIEWQGSKKILELGQKLQNFKGIESVNVPKILNAELRDYQQEGVNWLQFLREYEFSGILADDMGLGKTIQTLTHIALLKESGVQAPVLVITPTSVAYNWQIEASKFTPDLKVLVLHGMQRKEYFDNIYDYDIVITTYPLIIRDHEFFLKQTFDTVILDEAQYIKNAQAKVTKIICKLNADNKLCLTGTPIENHLSELWSQFNFLMPGFLGSSKEFRRMFKDPIEKSQDSNVLNVLVKRIKPFMLRRNKNQVVQELPPKTEIIKNIEIDKEQRDLYEAVRITMHQRVKDEIEKKGFQKSHITVLDALLKLRQICCDPRLLKMKISNATKESAKLDTLMNMLPEMLEEGRKIIVFSQFVSMIELIEARLSEKNINYVKLIGSTVDRKTPISQFQEGNIPVFLISLKSGGTGINLTAADTIIHYDPWWNPAAEDQATDRAHRMGQEKAVFVYKLITKGTVEEKIVEMQQHKRNIAQGIFENNSGSKSKLSIDDINHLFDPLEG